MTGYQARRGFQTPPNRGKKKKKEKEGWKTKRGREEDGPKHRSKAPQDRQGSHPTRLEGRKATRHRGLSKASLPEHLLHGSLEPISSRLIDGQLQQGGGKRSVGRDSEQARPTLEICIL